MTFEIDIAGRSVAVSVERIAGTGHYRVAVGGRARVVDAVRVGNCGLSLLVMPAPSPAAAASSCPGVAVSREIAAAPGAGAGELLLAFDGRTVPVSVNARRTGRGAAEAGGHAHGEQPVVAPMPGRVVRVLVSRGDEVSARQGVVVVEAMKMENELRAPKAGRVKDVTVSAGASVEAGRVLVVIE